MRIKKITIDNYKVLYHTEINPGKVNVFIGKNGAGKSIILDAIGILYSAMTDGITNSALQQKGVRLGPPDLYRSRFLTLQNETDPISLSAEWIEDDNILKYTAILQPPTEMAPKYWKYVSELFAKNGKEIFTRPSTEQIKENMKNNNSMKKAILEEYPDMKYFIPENNNSWNYGIYQPYFDVMRGNIVDPLFREPLGLHGGRLAEATKSMVRVVDGQLVFGNLDPEKLFSFMPWASTIIVTRKDFARVVERVLEFTDKYLPHRVKFSSYDISDGNLYILFLICLMQHPEISKIFAIENFAYGLDNDAAMLITKMFCNMALQRDKTVFLTTHDPFVVKALDLDNDDIRLFSVERNEKGYAEIKRIISV